MGIVRADSEELKRYTVMASFEIEKMRSKSTPKTIPEYLKPFLWSELTPQNNHPLDIFPHRIFLLVPFILFHQKKTIPLEILPDVFCWVFRSHNT